MCDFGTLSLFMKLRLSALLLVLSLGGAQGQSGDLSAFHPPAGVRYTLLDGSFFVDDCLVCGRPTILQPLRGTFDLVLLQDTPPFTKYAVRNIDFVASPGFAGEATIQGGGTYEIFSEFAVIQRMELTTEIRDAFTNHKAFFASSSEVAQRPFPAIEISLTQTNGTLLQTFSLVLVAAPIREVWCSLNNPLVATTSAGTTVRLSPGDLISNQGRVVKSNLELLGRLGIMPVVPDLGLDAVTVIRRGEILFSTTQSVWSELLGPLQHGDLLSNGGRIVKRNQQLLAAFGAAPDAPDAGLDAVQVMPDGEVLFSISSPVTLSSGKTLRPGDVLSDTGQVFRTQEALLAHFHPAEAQLECGLDALWVLPGGEIWFSVERGFADNHLGTVGPGDVLSDRGYRVLNNRQLVAAFHPQDPSSDYGLDALFVVTGLKPALPPPRIFRMNHDGSEQRICLEWDGEGSVFQVEQAPGPHGPWTICSPLLPDLRFDEPCAGNREPGAFYRLRQW